MKPVINPKTLEFSLCRDSFYDFVRQFWSEVIHEEPVWNWHIEAICHVLQEAAERVFKGLPKLHDIVINVPPGTSKSTICSIMFPAWVWTRMPSARSICASYAHDLAMDLSRKSRDIVKSEKWKRLFGDVQLREDQNAKGYFINNRGGDRYCVGTNGAVTGFHGHFLIVDDPLDPNRAFSEADLKSANRWVAETLSRRKVNPKVTVTILIMQRLHQNDPSAVMLKNSRSKGGAKIKHVNLPAEVVGSGLDVVRPRKLAKFYKDGLLDAERLTHAVLDEAKVTLGPFGYAGQMLQRPTPRGGGQFKIDRIRVEQPPRAVDFKQRVRFWDKAGTRDGGAFTAGVLIGEDLKGQFWILHVVRGQWDSFRREDTIHQTARVDTPKVVVGVEQEPGSGGKESAEATVRRLAGFRVKVERPTGDKELRAEPFSIQVNAGNVFLAPGDWNQAYLDELENFPRGYKDQVDASSGGFTILTQKKVMIGAGWFRKPQTAAAMGGGVIPPTPTSEQVQNAPTRPQGYAGRLM